MGAVNAAKQAGPALAAAAALLVGVGPVEAQSDALALVERVEARYRDVDVLCADFTQRLEVPLLGDEATGTGRLCQGRPNLFAMRFGDPEGDAIVADGSAVWIYLPSSQPGQVLKLAPERTAGGHDFHREFLEDTGAKYEVTLEGTDMVDGDALTRLRLVPRQRAGYRAAVLWIDAEALVLRSVRVEEDNGTVRTVTLRNVDLEAEPGADWFTFVPPAGTSVLIG